MWSLVHSVRTAETALTPGVLLGIGQTNKWFQNVLGLLELIPSNYKKHLGSFKSARHICCFLHAGFEVHYLTTNYCFSFSSGRRVPQ